MPYKLLDLFCGAGGAAEGYHRAGFKVTGVDIAKRNSIKRLSYIEYVRSDVFELDLSFLKKFDIIHASPPCQAYSTITPDRTKHVHYVDKIRAAMLAANKPYIIENVVHAPLLESRSTLLCGTMFEGLRVIRHRLFETSFKVPQPPHTEKHPKLFTNDERRGRLREQDEMTMFVQVTGGGNCSRRAAADAMKINWMKWKYELNEAIPPAYTQYIGKYAMRALEQKEEFKRREDDQPAYYL